MKRAMHVLVAALAVATGLPADVNQQRDNSEYQEILPTSPP